MRAADKVFLWDRLREKNMIIEVMNQLYDEKDEYINTLAKRIELRDGLIETLNAQIKELKSTKVESKWWRFW